MAALVPLAGSVSAGCSPREVFLAGCPSQQVFPSVPPASRIPPALGCISAAHSWGLCSTGLCRCAGRQKRASWGHLVTKLLAMDKAVTVQLGPLPGASALSCPRNRCAAFLDGSPVVSCSLPAAPLAGLSLPRCSPPTPGAPACVAVPLLSPQSRCWHPHPGCFSGPACAPAAELWAGAGRTQQRGGSLCHGSTRLSWGLAGGVVLSCDYAFVAANPHAGAILSMPNSIILRREFKNRLLLPKYCTLGN